MEYQCGVNDPTTCQVHTSRGKNGSTPVFNTKSLVCSRNELHTAHTTNGKDTVHVFDIQITYPTALIADGFS